MMIMLPLHLLHIILHSYLLVYIIVYLLALLYSIIPVVYRPQAQL